MKKVFSFSLFLTYWKMRRKIVNFIDECFAFQLNLHQQFLYSIISINRTVSKNFRFNTSKQDFFSELQVIQPPKQMRLPGVLLKTKNVTYSTNRLKKIRFNPLFCAISISLWKNHKFFNAFSNKILLDFFIFKSCLRFLQFFEQISSFVSSQTMSYSTPWIMHVKMIPYILVKRIYRRTEELDFFFGFLTSGSLHSALNERYDFSFTLNNKNKEYECKTLNFDLCFSSFLVLCHCKLFFFH